MVKRILRAYQDYVGKIATQVGAIDEAAALDAIEDAIDWRGPRNELQAALEDALRDVTLKGMDRGLQPLKSLADYEKFKSQFLVDNPYLKPWVGEHGAALVTEIDDNTRAGLRASIDGALDSGATWRDLKRQVKQQVGLLERDAIAVQGAYDKLISAGISESEAAAEAADYATKLHARRAENIARTEIIFAENYGQQAAFKTAKDVGLISDATKRVWISSPPPDAPAGRRCTICGSLDGQKVGIDEPFMSDVLGEIAQPPAHPSCRCTMGLVTDLGKRALVLKGDFVGTDDDQRLVFGWLSVVADVDGNPVVDLQGDVIPPEVLEGAVYEFVLTSRKMGEMHERVDGVGRLVESMMFTADKLEALGLTGKLPIGWWVGYRVDDDNTWAAIKSGDYPAFSIGGVADTVAA